MADIKKVLDKMIEQIKEKGADSGQVFVTESEDTEFNAECCFEVRLMARLINIIEKMPEKFMCFAG